MKSENCKVVDLIVQNIIMCNYSKKQSCDVLLSLQLYLNAYCFCHFVSMGIFEINDNSLHFIMLFVFAMKISFSCLSTSLSHDNATA